MYETLLFDGVDVKVPGVRSIEVWDGALATPRLRGGDLRLPGRDGEKPVDDLPFEADEVGVGLTLDGTDRTVFNDVFRALRRMVNVDGTVTLTRRLSYTTGDEEHTCLARYMSGLNPALTAAMTATRLALVMKNLWGLWYGPQVIIADGTHTVLGDARTRWMTVTFSGGVNPELTNTTTGDVLGWTGSPGGSDVVVDVSELTATRAGVDVSAAMSWQPRTFPMTLRPGPNTLVLTGGGAVSIAYWPAFL
jgi:hypothetical protein